MLKAYCKGILTIGNVELDCYVLDDQENTRILSATSIFKAFGRPRKGINDRLIIDGVKVPPFIAAKSFKTLINKELLSRTRLIEFNADKSNKTGFDANILPELCSLYLEARRHNYLTASQIPLAEKAEILLSAFAKVGIVALVDEATGFQHSRKSDALRILLEKYIADGMQKWIKTFPDAFFQQLDRLYKNTPTISRKRPQYYGKFITQYIYDPIEHGYVKARLDELNKLPDGKRKARFHQWLNEFGKHQLELQIGKILGIMEISPTLESFKKHQSKQLQLSLFDDYDYE